MGTTIFSSHICASLTGMRIRSSIQRIVITSSCVAILHHLTEPITVSEADWNDAEVTECEKKGRDASGLHKYAASKTLAEKGVHVEFPNARGLISD
jgi:nucleoside-diphosphate-sugar epimerase